MFLCAATAAAIYSPGVIAQVDVGVSLTISTPTVKIHAAADFYEPLTPYGRWEVVGSYGRCWVPTGVAVGWYPYSAGHWQLTEAGWFWVSDEPWGWATYHYGYWDFEPSLGWYWIPGTQWAPAWVSWRRGGGYIGWAPLGPHGAAKVASVNFVFVEEHRFLEPVRPTTVIVKETTIIEKTKVVNNTRVVNNVTINEGPEVALVEKASGKPIRRERVQQLRDTSESKVAKGKGESAEQSAVEQSEREPEQSQTGQVEQAPVRAEKSPAETLDTPTKPDPKGNEPEPRSQPAKEQAAPTAPQQQQAPDAPAKKSPQAEQKKKNKKSNPTPSPDDPSSKEKDQDKKGPPN